LTDDFKTLDLSFMSFDEFVAFFFNRDVVPFEKQFDYFLIDLAGEHYDEHVPSSPTIVVKHMAKLFSDFGQIAPRYSPDQVDQAIWGILGENLRLYEFLFDPLIPIEERLACIRSMYHVYSDYVAKLQVAPDPDATAFFMWWDLILHGFWIPPGPLVDGRWERDVTKLDSDSCALMNEMFETLKRILDLPDTETQRSALHGLGHLYHPGVHDTVQHYIDAKKSKLPLEWIENCRDCTVL
jgi:hypothetical protein